MPEPMVTLIDTPEAEAIAARFEVPAAIHAGDFMFMFHLGPDQDDWPRTRPAATELYFSDGARSAARLDELVARFHCHRGQRRLRVLEFASGYGMVSRHIARMNDRYALMACDIHEQAVAFQQAVLGVKAIPSTSDPEALILPGGFDVVFALSFFSHVCPGAWGRWLQTLSNALADNGLLIFTAHGRGGYDRAGQPPFQPEGFCFIAGSEQKDLSAQDYGTMLISPFYAFEKIERCERVEIALFEAASWWADQDTYVLRKTRASLPCRRHDDVPHAVQAE